MRYFIFLSALLFSMASCNTRLIVSDQNIEQQPLPNRIVVIPNDSSHFFPAAIYPSYKVVDKYVVKTIAAMYPIDSLICAKFRERDIECTIADKAETHAMDAPYIIYQDYWTWDFTDYMHILKMQVYNSNGSELIEVISQGNTGGMHNYPKPKKQVPKMVSEIIESGFRK